MKKISGSVGMFGFALMSIGMIEWQKAKAPMSRQDYRQLIYNGDMLNTLGVPLFFIGSSGYLYLKKKSSQ